MDDQPPRPHKKRKSSDQSQTTTRRALSCTECKRRKTKCSALGVIPCEACVKRHKPEDCFWEDGPGRMVDPTLMENHGLLSDIKTLQREVKVLREVLTAHLSKSCSASPNKVGEDNTQTSTALSTFPDGEKVDNPPIDTFKTTLDDLEKTIIGPYPGSRIYQPVHDNRVFANTIYDGILKGLEPGTIGGGWLVGAFFSGQLHRGWKAIHRSSFIIQYDQLAVLSHEDQRLAVDYAWLAQYMMILAMAIKFSETHHIRPLFPTLDDLDIAELPMILHQNSIRSLEEADYLAVPQIRHIQVALLYIVSLFHFGDSPGQANLAYRHLGSAITTAQWLGLDDIDVNPQNIPYDDPALSVFPPWIAIELCKQLFHMLSFIDGTIARNGSRFRLNDAATSFKTCLPLNFTDDDLQGASPALERPNSEFTESSLPRIGSRFATLVRRHTHDHSLEEMTREQSINFDRALHGILSDFPSNMTDLSSGRDDSMSSWMMPLLFCSIHNRLLRLHRPRLVREYTQEGSRTSRMAAVYSAKCIIDCQLNCSRYRYLRPGFARRWVLGGALTLAIDIVLRAHSLYPNDWPHSQMDSRTGIVHALEIARSPTPLEAEPHITRGCEIILEALLATVDRISSTPRMGIAVEADLHELFQGVKSLQGLDSVRSSGQVNTPGPDLSLFDSTFDWLVDLPAGGEGSTNQANPWDGWFFE